MVVQQQYVSYFFSLVLLLLLHLVTLEAKSTMKKDIVKGECVVDGVAHKTGDKWPGPVGVCTTNNCVSSGAVYSLTCPEVRVREGSGCTISPYDLTVKHPHCCPKVSCPKESRPESGDEFNDYKLE